VAVTAAAGLEWLCKVDRATAASVDRVVLRFSKLMLDRPSSMLAHFRKDVIVWSRVA